MASEHAVISYVKSGVRILGYFLLGCVGHQHPCIVAAAVLLTLAEIIGIIEEFGH